MTDVSKEAVDVAANVLRITDEHYIASLLTALRAALDEAEAERDAANALLQRLTEWDECWPSKDVQNITHEARAHLGAKP